MFPRPSGSEVTESGESISFLFSFLLKICCLGERVRGDQAWRTHRSKSPDRLSHFLSTWNGGPLAKTNLEHRQEMFIFREHPCGEKQRRHPLYSSRAAARPAPTACMRPTRESKGEMGQESPGGSGDSGEGWRCSTMVLPHNRPECTAVPKHAHPCPQIPPPPSFSKKRTSLHLRFPELISPSKHLAWGMEGQWGAVVPFLLQRAGTAL